MNDASSAATQRLERALADAASYPERIDALNALALHVCAVAPQRGLALSLEAVNLARAHGGDAAATARLVASLHNLSACQDRLGNDGAALAALLQALAAAEEQTLLPEVAQSHLALALAYKARQDFARALFHHEQFYRVKQELRHHLATPFDRQDQPGSLLETPEGTATRYYLRNVELEHEIAERLRAEAALKRADNMLQARVNELSLLNYTTRVVLEQTDLSSILATVTRQVTEILGASGTIIALLNPDAVTITFVADHDHDPQARSFAGLSMSLADVPSITDVLGAQQPLVLTQPIIDTLIATFDTEPRLGRFHCLLLVPLNHTAQNNGRLYHHVGSARRDV